MNIPYIITDKTVTAIVEGKVLTMNQDHPNFDAATTALNDESTNEQDVKNLFNVGAAIEDLSQGDIVVKDGVAYHKGEAIDNYCVDRAIAFMRENKPYKALLKFFDRLQANPSKRAVNELYRFLEHKNMPITPDGHFIAYKGVDLAYMDKYSRKFNNSVGQVLEMTRNKVDDDASIGCSSGFHAGSYEYADGYGGQNGRLMLVKIDPADVVSVPNDCGCQKLRTCRYEVVSELEERKPLEECYNGQYGDLEDESEDDSEFFCEGCDYTSKDPNEFYDDGREILCETCTEAACGDQTRYKTFSGTIATNEDSYADSSDNHGKAPIMDQDDVAKQSYKKGYTDAMDKFHSERDCLGRFCPKTSKS
tara:strand:- start:624 stop:1712 length:1089 start_codon:yes stop_codon:yes gene_type:complete